MSASSKVTLTAELKDELSAPLQKVEKQVEKTSKTVEESNKAQASSTKETAKAVEESNKAQSKSTQDAAKVIETATARATGAQADMEKAIERATGKRNDSLHSFEQASKGVTIAEQRLEAAREKAEGGSVAVLTAEKQLEAARYKQEKALQAVATATGDLQEAQAALIDQNGDLESAPAPRVRATREESLSTLAPAVTAVGGAMTLGFGKVLTTYAGFDKAMSQVKAFTQESDANMALLRDSAMKYGADTAYSAEEAAGAINELGKAGVSTQDILSGGLGGALTLAAAGELEVTKAAEIASAAMTQFKLSGDQIPHLADLLAAGAGKAMGSVEDLGMALNQAGLVASGTGLNIEETTGTLAAFASNGLLGSDAGTSFKTMLQRLTPQSKEAAKEMERLKINAYDANGEFIGMSNFAGVLRDGMKELTDEQRMASMGIIFGSDAIRAANVLYEQGADGISSWTDAVNDAGYAARTAGDLQDNLAGDIEKLGGSIDTVFLQSGSGMNDILRDIVQSAEDLVDWLGTLDPKMLSLFGVIGSGVGVLAVVGGAFMMLVPKIKEAVTAYNDLKAAHSKTFGVLGKIGAMAGVAGVLVLIGQAVGSMITDKDIADAHDYAEAVRGIVKDGNMDMSQIFDKADKVAGVSRIDGITNLSEAIESVANPSVGERLNKNLNFMNGWFNLPDDKITQLETRFKGVGDELGQLATSGYTKQASDAFRELTNQFEQQGMTAQDALNYMPGYRDALREQANALGENVSEQELLTWALTGMEPAAVTAARATKAAADGMDTGAKAAGGMSISVEEATEYLDEFGVTLDGVVSNMEKYLDFLFATGLAVMSSRDAQVSYQEASRGIGETVKELTDKNGVLSGVLNQNKTDFDLTTEAGGKANAAFQDLARGGMDQVKALANEGLGQDVLQEKLSGTYKDLVTAAGQFDITGGAAEELARKVLGVPEGVKIDSWMSDEAKRMAEETRGLVEQLDGSTANVWVTTHKKSIYSESHVSSGVGGGGGQTANSGGGVYTALGRAAGGAVVPGYAPGIDSEMMLVSPGEALLVPELVQAIGPSNIMTLNHLYSNGRPAGGGPARATIGNLLASMGPSTALARAAGGAVVPGYAPGIDSEIVRSLDELVAPTMSVNLGLSNIMSAPVIPDTVPAAWVQEFTPEQVASTPAPAPSLTAPPSTTANSSSITLSEGAVQVTVPAEAGFSRDEVVQMVQEAVTAALEEAQREKEHAY